MTIVGFVLFFLAAMVFMVLLGHFLASVLSSNRKAILERIEADVRGGKKVDLNSLAIGWAKAGGRWTTFFDLLGPAVRGLNERTLKRMAKLEGPTEGTRTVTVEN